MYNYMCYCMCKYDMLNYLRNRQFSISIIISKIIFDTVKYLHLYVENLIFIVLLMLFGKLDDKIIIYSYMQKRTMNL